MRAPIHSMQAGGGTWGAADVQAELAPVQSRPHPAAGSLCLPRKPRPPRCSHPLRVCVCPDATAPSSLPVLVTSSTSAATAAMSACVSADTTWNLRKRHMLSRSSTSHTMWLHRERGAGCERLQSRKLQRRPGRAGSVPQVARGAATWHGCSAAHVSRSSSAHLHSSSTAPSTSVSTAMEEICG